MKIALSPLSSCSQTRSTFNENELRTPMNDTYDYFTGLLTNVDDLDSSGTGTLSAASRLAFFLA